MSIVMATIPAETVPPHRITAAIGLTIGLGELVGGFAAPTLAGVAADIWGPTMPLWLASAATALAAVVALFIVPRDAGESTTQRSRRTDRERTCSIQVTRPK